MLTLDKFEEASRIVGEVTLENLRPYVAAGGAAETAEATGG